MKYVFLALYFNAFSSHLIAEEENPAEESVQWFELGEISAPFSFYTEDWDPTQELLPILPGGQRVEKKDLIVDLDKSIREAREREDFLRSQKSWSSTCVADSSGIEEEGFDEEEDEWENR